LTVACVLATLAEWLKPGIRSHCHRRWPGGLRGAIRAGQLGKKVACIELERAGGTCLNWGCIPTKALLKSAEFYRSLQKADTLGIRQGRRLRFREGDGSFAQRRGGRWPRGSSSSFGRTRSITSSAAPGDRARDGRDHRGRAQGKVLQDEKRPARHGLQAAAAAGCPVDGQRVFTSREALEPRKAPPKSMVIIGAGAIGVEFAYFYNAFGSKVTLVEMLPQVVPVEDEDVAKALQRSFEKQGITVHVNTKVENVRVTKDKVELTLVKTGEANSTEVEAESLLVAIGVSPNLEGALSSKVKLELERGYVKVNDNYESSVKGIYAAGDIIGPPWLAHVATFEAVNAVNAMFGHHHAGRVKIFPGDVLPAADREHGPHGKGREGEKARLQGRQVSVHRVRQGGRRGRRRRLRKGDHRCEDGRNLRRAHHRQRGPGADRGIRARDEHGRLRGRSAPLDTTRTRR
jgi:dihydrolipoamide dehydrogenase